MTPRFETEKGWTEAIIDDDCRFEKFNKIGELLVSHFNVVFTNKINDFDSYYCDFEYIGSELVLHYNIYMGVSIFPRAFKSATQKDNDSVVEISTLVFQKLIDLD